MWGMTSKDEDEDKRGDGRSLGVEVRGGKEMD